MVEGALGRRTEAEGREVVLEELRKRWSMDCAFSELRAMVAGLWMVLGVVWVVGWDCVGAGRGRWFDTIRKVCRVLLLAGASRE